MSGSLAIGSALPPALDTFIRQTVAHGAAPLPLAQLNTEVPTIAPFVMDLGGMYTLTVYPGPCVQFSAAPKLGHYVDTRA